MEEIVSITKFAKMCNITTETLRYYDRIDMIKPDKIDQKTGMRYYSVHQYEKVGIIKELQQMGLTLKDIKEYLDDRNIKKTYEILMKEKKAILKKINNLKELYKKVESKIQFLDEAIEYGATDEIVERYYDSRYFLTSPRIIKDEVGCSVECAKLEKQITDVEKFIPVFASDIFTGFVTLEDVYKGQYENTEMAVRLSGGKFVQKDLPNLRMVPAGDFLCKYYVGDFWTRKKSIEAIKTYAKNRNYELCNPVIVSAWIDIGISDDESEIGFVIQIPFHKKEQK